MESAISLKAESAPYYNLSYMLNNLDMHFEKLKKCFYTLYVMACLRETKTKRGLICFDRQQNIT